MKKIPYLTAMLTALLISAISYAQGKYTNVELTIKRGDGVFQKKEKVEVWALKHKEDGETLTLTLQENGKDVVKTAPLRLKAGKKKKILSKRYPDPTAVLVKVAPEGMPKTFSAVGLVVAADEFRPGFTEPSDFVPYWEGQVSQMRSCKMAVTLTPAEIPEDRKKYRDRVEVYDLEISMHEGNPVRAYIAWPKNAAPGSCGIMICPHGSGVQSSNLNNAIFRADTYHCIVIDINAHGILNAQPEAYYQALSDGALKDYRKKKCFRREDNYFRLMYLRMQRALDYACTLSQWDGQRVALDGTSQGGGQSAALAGLDPRVGFVSLQVPALTDIGGPFAGHRGSWPYYGKFDESRDGDYRYVLPYYDAANFLRHYKGILFVEAGMIDTTCPPECVYAAYNVAASADKTIYTTPYRDHGEKSLWEKNLDTWRASVSQARKEAIMNYLTVK